MNLIKGGGGALLREKVVACASKREIIVVDESKLSARLGTLFALPVEVVPFAWAIEKQFIEGLGPKSADAEARTRLRPIKATSYSIVASPPLTMPHNLPMS